MVSLPTTHKRITYALPYERVGWRHLWTGRLGCFNRKAACWMRLSDVVDFEAVQVPEILVDEKDLSSDQKYFLGIFNAVRMGFTFSSSRFAKTRTSQPLTLVDNCMPDTFLPPNHLLH